MVRNLAQKNRLKTNVSFLRSSCGKAVMWLVYRWAVTKAHHRLVRVSVNRDSSLIEVARSFWKRRNSIFTCDSQEHLIIGITHAITGVRYRKLRLTFEFLLSYLLDITFKIGFSCPSVRPFVRTSVHTSVNISNKHSYLRTYHADPNQTRRDAWEQGVLVVLCLSSWFTTRKMSNGVFVPNFGNYSKLSLRSNTRFERNWLATIGIRAS